MTIRALIVEDEQNLVSLLRLHLEREGFEVHEALDGRTALEVAHRVVPDVVVLDWMLPGLGGMEVLRELRDSSDAYVIMLTARTDEVDRVVGLSTGADDYLTKPFSPAELVARIRAMTRRTDQVRSSALQAGDMTLDLISRRCWRDTTSLDLSSREFALLEYFMRNPGRLLTRQQILSAIWEYDFDPESNIVDVYVRYLRRKIDPKGEPSRITTLRGMGYRFDPVNGGDAAA